MRTMSLTEAKRHFGGFLKIIQNEPVLVTKRGKEAGVAVSPELYEKLFRTETQEQPLKR